MLSQLSVVSFIFAMHASFLAPGLLLAQPVNAIPVLEISDVLQNRDLLSGKTIRVRGILTIGAEHNTLYEDGCSKFKDDNNKDWACALWLVGSISKYVTSPPSNDSKLLSEAMKSRSWDVVHRFEVVIEGSLRSGGRIPVVGLKTSDSPERGYGHLNSYLGELAVARLLTIRVPDTR
jgi:hypothetical protein